MRMIKILSLAVSGILCFILGWQLSRLHQPLPEAVPAPRLLSIEEPAPEGPEDAPLTQQEPAPEAPVEAHFPSFGLRVPPLNLDENMIRHLEEFRVQAGELSKQYPADYLLYAPGEEKRIALTFDDGPDLYATPRILDILKEAGVRATFFVQGQNGAKYPDILDRMSREGHLIANHSWSHPRPFSIEDEALLEEVEKTQALLEDMPRFFRPPYGLVSPSQMEKFIQAGYRAVAWSVDSMDWYAEDPDEIKKCVLENIHPGAIILMHCAGGPDNRRATVEALGDILAALKDRGYEPVTIDELLKKGAAAQSEKAY